VPLDLFLLGRISGRLRTIRCTTTLAFAGVLPLATIVAGLAPTLAFAGVLALTSMLFSFVLVTHSSESCVALVQARRLCVKVYGCTCQ